MTPRAALNALLASDKFHALEARLRRLSAFHILRIDTRELSHAALLAWLLDPRASHGMGPEPLRRFVLLAARLDSSEATLDAVDIDQLDLSDALTETEVWIEPPGSQGRRRLDILVSAMLPGDGDAKPILVIEYKVDASESADQTADYARWAATQGMRFTNREVLPLQVYLCPVASDESAPAPPFVTMGYDAYLGWAEGLAKLEKTAQATLLLDEWRACLQVRNDIMDEEQEELTSTLEAQHADALRALRTAPRAELAPYQAVIDQHAEALVQLGVRAGRRVGQSKGYSGVIALMRDTLKQRLNLELWQVRGGGGSLGAVFLPFVCEVASWANSTLRVSGVRAQIYADRAKGGRFRVVLEVIGDLPGWDRETTLDFRRAAAEQLRQALTAVDPTLTLRQWATCLSFMVVIPEVLDVETDTDENAAAHQAEMDAVAVRLASFEPTLTDWCETALPALLRKFGG